MRGSLDRETGQRSFLIEESERIIAGEEPPLPLPDVGNTTLTVVVTNQQLDDRSLGQLGRQVHSSMARAIQPFHTLYDGDVLFAVSTNEILGDGLDVGPLAHNHLRSGLGCRALQLLSSFMTGDLKGSFCIS